MGLLSQPSGKGLPLGLTGAIAATRYVGATASGAPASGTFAVGDFIIDQTGKVYVCTVAGTPGTWVQAGSTYTPPTDREQLNGNAVSIANNASGILTWDTKLSGTTLLDLSNTQVPTAITAGIYAISVWVRPQAAMTAGGEFELLLDVDRGGDDAQLIATSPNALVGGSQPRLAMELTYYVPVGGQVRLQCSNQDGAQTLNFLIEQANVQRIT